LYVFEQTFEDDRDDVEESCDWDADVELAAAAIVSPPAEDAMNI
jgi:hypothetical protein